MSCIDVYKSLSFSNDMTSFQIQTILQLTSIFENSSKELQFNYTENINDGRGITFGFVGFCSGTYDGSKIIRKYNELTFNTDTRAIKYLKALEKIDKEGKELNPSVKGLDGFIRYIQKIGKSPQFIQASLVIADELYVKPSQKMAETLGLKFPISKGQLYDSYINHGESGALKMIKQAGPVKDEIKWLTNYLNIRLKVLSADKTWKEAIDRIKVYQKLLSNPTFISPFNVTCYGNTFKF